jgi:hypothetical protein
MVSITHIGGLFLVDNQDESAGISKWRDNFYQSAAEMLSPDPMQLSLRCLDIIFYPSFNPEARIVISEHPEGSHIELLLMSASKSMYDSYCLYVEQGLWRDDQVVPPVPEVLRDSGESSDEDARVFWKQVSSCEPESVPVGKPPRGLFDGISICFRYTEGMDEYSFRAWSYHPHSRKGQMIQAAHRLATSTLNSTVSSEWLEQFYSYLRG